MAGGKEVYLLWLGKVIGEGVLAVSLSSTIGQAVARIPRNDIRVVKYAGSERSGSD